MFCMRIGKADMNIQTHLMNRRSSSTNFSRDGQLSASLKSLHSYVDPEGGQGFGPPPPPTKYHTKWCIFAILAQIT